MAQRGGGVREHEGGYQRKQLDAFQRDMSRCIVTPGYLRDDTLVTGLTVQTVNWTLTQVANTVALSTSQRLKNNDAFLVTDVGMFFGVAATTGGAAPTAPQLNAMVLHSFPELDALGVNGVVAANVIALNQAYNGWISIKEGSTTFYEQLEAYSFVRVPTSQSGTLVFTASTLTRSGWEGMNYGFIPVTPQFRMAGNRTYITTLNLGAAAAFAALSGTTGAVYMTLRFKGFLATGGAAFVKNNNVR